MDLLHLYIVNIFRPIFENPKLGGDGGEEEAGAETEKEKEDEEEVEEGGGDGPKGAKGESRRANKRLENIELLDSSGPKLMHGLRHWILIYQILGQLNLIGKPLYISILYKSILLTLCSYVLYLDFLEPFTVMTSPDDFKNPIFAFISLSSVITLALLALLTLYNNLFNWCPIFKVLTTERLCFVHRDVQDIVGNRTIPAWIIFFAFNSVLCRMLVAKSFQDFIYEFDIVRFLMDFFALLCIGYHWIGMSVADFYIRVCFGVWIIAMKTNLENRFAYFQKHQQVPRRLNSALRHKSLSSSALKRNATSDSMATNCSNVATKPAGQLGPDQRDEQMEHSSEPRDSRAKFGHKSPRSISTSSSISVSSGQFVGGDQPNQLAKDRADTVESAADARLKARSTSQQALATSHLTLADFRAKYKIDTMDEIQKNLNTMDDHLEVVRDFQNGMMVLITLSAFLTNGALLLLAYNLLANQGNYFHGVVIILVVVSYTVVIFVSYIGDSWISYALESFVQTVEDEYFLQGSKGEQMDDTLDNQQQAGASPPSSWPAAAAACNTAGETSDTGSEVLHYADSIRQHHQLFIIKKRDVLFCREFLNQFQNHLATPWSKLTVKVQLHMLRTFVTLIAAQIIFDGNH